MFPFGQSHLFRLPLRDLGKLKCKPRRRSKFQANARRRYSCTFAATPLGRIGRPQDIASIAVFLASDDAAFINGTTIVADGGLTASTGTPF